MATAETEPATSHSGKLLVRMPRTLHAELAAAADHEGVSLNAFIVGALGGAVAWRAGEAPPHAAAPNGHPPDRAAATPAAASAPARTTPPSRTLSVALVVNLVVVVLAAAAAVALVIAAWPA
jgi:hypothetical protein